MSHTTDREDPRLTRGSDSEPTKQAEVYLVLSEEERAKGFVRPVRAEYRHVGLRPNFPLRDLTDEENERYGDAGYVKYEEYPKGRYPGCVTGRFWTQEELDTKGCGGVTKMSLPLAETYAREPKFYGATYCVHCRMHRPVAEFEWMDGTKVGS